ncbi:MAG TPA: bifunctional diaminohydroxyphosphoribosylaminopyrimidine deaminase/5-amino-6-(5-phosphoribosylamino)uracil reductase RibD, partial [Chitinophagaceae bacterium]|nr:bifunctional diaminohydroxyphosphoribosylaminopyrimidine deaminase/5-amino-6-(5-phosphoribosylamino)uracil reductase RibD [Chitinophagaceae bacterium]
MINLFNGHYSKLNYFVEQSFTLTADEKYMMRCLQLAKLGAGNVAPNPMVGAVLVHEDRIIGEGYHQNYGEAHAEVNCINNVAGSDKHLIDKSTLYVSLEPCSHYGKTPPCTDLIIRNKIPRVVIGCRDVYKEVAGRGIQKLQNAGVEVICDVLKQESICLNRRFFTFHTQFRPYFILKWAQTANNKIGAVEKRMLISNEHTNRLVHKWRSEEPAIMIGTNTALQDDPLLTTRLWKGKNPIRIVIDGKLKLPDSLSLFNNEAKTIVFNFHKNETKDNTRFIKLENENIVEEILHSFF